MHTQTLSIYLSIFQSIYLCQQLFLYLPKTSSVPQGRKGIAKWKEERVRERENGRSFTWMVPRCSEAGYGGARQASCSKHRTMRYSRCHCCSFFLPSFLPSFFLWWVGWISYFLASHHHLLSSSDCYIFIIIITHANGKPNRNIRRFFWPEETEPLFKTT